MPVTDRMPTASKFVGAICLGILGWVAAQAFRPLMPGETNFGWFNEVNLLLGIVCGWWILGPRAGFGYLEGLAAGFTGTAALVFWAVFAQGSNEMLKRALNRKYDGPFEAIVDIFSISTDFAMLLLHGPFIGLLVIGAFLSGLITEWTSQRFD